MTYKSELSFDEFKKYIAENDFIEIERKHNHTIGNTTYFRPKKASYQTKSIVYVNDETKWYKEVEECEARLKTLQEPLIAEISTYQYNGRMKWWWFWNATFMNADMQLEDFNPMFLEKVLTMCKKYKCKKKI